MTHVAQSKTATPSTSRQSPISATASPSPGPASPAAAPASAAQTSSAPSPSGSPAPSPAASGSSKPKSIQGEDPANVLGGEMLKGPVNISFPMYVSLMPQYKADPLERRSPTSLKRVYSAERRIQLSSHLHILGYSTMTQITLWSLCTQHPLSPGKG
jgi:hypothetical protein